MKIQGFINVFFLTIFLLLFVGSSSSTSSPEYEGNKVPHFTSDVEQASGKSFDYIIVGGGTSGCPLAATLSQRFSVLLVERGGSPYEDPLVIEKRNYGFPLIQTDEFTSIAQAFVSEEGVMNHRGRVLGGSTAINGGFYSRASKDFIKRIGWDEELVRDAYKWVESQVAFKPKRLTPWQAVTEDSFLEAKILPFNGFTLEHVEGTKIGGSIFDEHGKRHTAADLLRGCDYRRITILLNTTVNNIIFHEGDEIKPRAVGIRFFKSHGNPQDLHEAYLNKPENLGSWGDVILSAGALGSPQILMLSGIGPQQHLKHFNISHVIDAREVGKGIQDNPCISIFVNSSQTSQQQTDPPQVVGIANDFEIIIQSLILPISSNSTIVPVAAKIARPLSMGKLELRSTDPRQNPSVRFNYLAVDRDLDLCINMTLLIEKVVESKSIELVAGRQNAEIPNEKLRDFCKKNVRTFYHYHGGCNIGSVVDEDYRVRGVGGLRVIDGSTLPESPGTNPMATLLMLGRYQGIKMLKRRQK